MGTDRQQRLILRIEDWPEADRIAWAALFVRGGPLEADGLRAGWCAFTRTTYAESYGRWLAFLTRAGELDPATTPCERITRERIHRYVAYLADVMGSVTLAYRLDHLSLIARSFDSASDFRWLVRVVGRLRARARPRSRTLPPPAAEAFRAGLDQMKMAETKAGPRTRAAAYRNGLTVAMLAAVPIRSLNLVSIEIGKHLVVEGGVYWLHFTEPEMKNRRPFNCPLPAALTAFIDRYIEVHRPVLLKTGSRRLFISMRGKAVSKAGLSERVKTTTRRTLGSPVNVHAFRHMATTSIVIEDPAHAGIATPLLGHVSPEVTSRHYNMARQVEVGRALGETIMDLRRSSRRSRSSKRSP